MAFMCKVGNLHEMGHVTRKPDLFLHAKNKGADHPAHLCVLIDAMFCSLKLIIAKLATVIHLYSASFLFV